MIPIIEQAKTAMEEETFEQARSLLLPPAMAGNADAQCWLGYLHVTYAACCSAKEALTWFKKAAAQDHPEAWYDLATRSWSEEGDVEWGIPRQETQREWLQYAAQLGSANAQHDVGCLLCLGDYGFEKNPSQGRTWYREAAKQGHPCAQYPVGLMCLEGDGGVSDQEEGICWLEQSAASDA
jgi:TPR repeat protein